ncbi:ral guanine nucleotide dissociation stimulator-like 1 isoform X2 [Lutzomyia longipalpis]|uniref:ral guanine nucleotide dissociation stimulator-like 1 isoform X2 n=1 Tax=Lutzomyia longipalpis TaxID=7200 RepID=UPI0024841E75|nr:ral guanine nucleotide dissociation stimulator-like 1 isoform X2 [Lutzomyia longipalpis]XP_055691314.1 ral guanine nucleotide dissociation stimulator-like 1 isoform X2 [Lutzomyia longipalpis]XP_055691315.1 ral guanine nucleotide dissociation stimulator-like 1 isoform X2 [Lutzomyia longipalpis]XP_055691316.1 ral guanine nucleotide dissociation stimulator-like 1 isoform X2 [Lutzomyia longipalpis]XP_055691317.1 ral guanine nucleotide dissociation stimulator-like 1 isoform X2 [Lutzomyia longipal
MFCPSSDTIQTITEKTKLIAQKCSHQILAAAHQATTRDDQDLLLLKDNIGFRCFCPCKASIRLPKRNAPERTTKWYVKQPTWRLWGEEREKDAIFTVYLKKVRYHRPTPSASSQDSDDEISHLEWETVRVRFIKAATLPRLVEALATDDGELESTFINVFMATYRTFTQPEKVLELLLARYERLHAELLHSDTVSAEHKKSLISALHVWLDGYPEDWDSSTLQRLLTFTAKRLPNSEVHMKAALRLDRLARTKNNHPIRSWSSQDGLDLTDQFGGLCLTPAFRVPQLHILHSYRFPHVPVKHFAEQLTRMDMELFKRLVPHQCLGAIWSRKDKQESNTVLATVTQFNAVSFRVISSVLVEPRLKPQERAQIIATWIDIAQELRILKNFSSLKAIVSGLQSNAIYRLTKTWAALVREKLELFNELARIFSEDNNACAQREVLMREGTAKFADTAGQNDRHLQKVFQKQNTHISHGTIPYLGTFLTDLTMIHAAIPDTIGDGLINFDKRRKEFEVLAQIKLLQGAANAYHLPEDSLFDRWFASLLVLDEKEAHNLSCLLEPPTEVKKVTQGHKKSDSIASNSSSGAGSQFYCDFNNSTPSSRNNSLDRDATPPNASIMSAASSTSSLSLESSSTSSGQQHQKNQSNQTKVSHINAQLVQNSPMKNPSPDFYIIRVTYETENVELDGIVLYKSIMLGNNERTPQVIRNAMMKLTLEGDPDRYTLAQVLPDRELVMPASANVYYAVNTAHNLNFILRPKKEDTT